MKGKYNKLIKLVNKTCKKYCYKAKKSFKKYTSTNVLFLSYVTLSVILGFCLRMATVGTNYIFEIKPIFVDLTMVLIFGSFGYLFKPKNQFKYFFTWLTLACLVCMSNTIYYQFFKSFLSVNLISTASMLGQVNDSLFEKIYYYHFFYFIALIVFIYIHNKLSKKNYYFEVEKIEKGKKMFIYTIASAFIILIFIVFSLSKMETSRFIKQWNREYIVGRFGIYVYTVNDLIQSVQPKIDTLFGYDESARTFREYYSCKWNKKEVQKNAYTNKFKGKNVIFIHMESIQNFLIDLEINGEEVLPNINRLVKEGIYFNKFYPQISIGTSSDTEFTISTGLMPSSSGTVFVNYYNRYYESMQKYFSQMGYYTFSMHANNADYWNRKIMHNNLGYMDFYAKDKFVIPPESDMEYIGLGLSDKSFFKQILPILTDIKNKKQPYFGTIITLSNHSPFSDIEKYGDFNVKMKYTYYDEVGNFIEGEADYLENTSMGNYIKSSHYADAALGQFFEDLEKTSLVDNTIFILYGDHEARLAKKQFNRLYNYDPIKDEIKSEEDETYINLDNYQYDLLKNTPLIIWSSSKKYNKTIDDVMGMYDILPTIANMFGFKAKYALGNDIFSNNEKIVVFPNGNVLTNKVYYDSSNDQYIVFNDEIIESDYIERISNYANEILEISQGIITHNLIKTEEAKIGECENEK